MGLDKSLQVSNEVCHCKGHWGDTREANTGLGWLLLQVMGMWGGGQGMGHLWHSLCSQGNWIYQLRVFPSSVLPWKQSPSKHLASLNLWLGQVIILSLAIFSLSLTSRFFFIIFQWHGGSWRISSPGLVAPGLPSSCFPLFPFFHTQTSSWCGPSKCKFTSVLTWTKQSCKKLVSN